VPLTLLQYESAVMPLAMAICAYAAGSAAAASVARAASGEERRMVQRGVVRWWWWWECESKRVCGTQMPSSAAGLGEKGP
jgi:hypothetical protein